MPDTVLSLGDFDFSRFEVPEQIPFGGEQRLVVHELVGGVRVVDAMGESPTALEWSGIFVGQAALDRALYLDGLRKAANQLLLTWSELAYNVVIRSLRCTFQRSYRLPYSITCEVVEDVTSPVNVLVQTDVDQTIDDDMADASAAAGTIGDTALSGFVADVQIGLTAARAVTGGSLDGILRPLGQAQSRVGVLLGIANAAITGSSAVGGIASQISAVGQTSALLSLTSSLGRVAANVGTASVGARSITQAGGDLYELAADHFGDAMAWPAIAKANGLSDPQLSGITTLRIPAVVKDLSGILRA